MEYIDLGTEQRRSSRLSGLLAAPWMQTRSPLAAQHANEVVIVCGTGIGISIAANRVAGIRAAAVCHNAPARVSREHNDANVVALGARIVGGRSGESLCARFCRPRSTAANAINAGSRNSAEPRSRREINRFT